jgi:[ribosomal protein S5]-alanine N-acetyltransferase
VDRVALSDGPVGVRLLRVRDAAAWTEVRNRNEEWLSPWEGRVPRAPDVPWAQRHTAGVFVGMVRQQRREARLGRALPFAITYEGALVGQVTVGSIVRGAFDSGFLGYWVDGRVAGRGVMPTAVALVVDHCFRTVGLHRVNANVRPENTASRRVVEKLGFREEGLHLRYLFIDGAWRDHVAYALTVEDVPEGLLARWHANRGD